MSGIHSAVYAARLGRLDTNDSNGTSINTSADVLVDLSLVVVTSCTRSHFDVLQGGLEVSASTARLNMIIPGVEGARRLDYSNALGAARVGEAGTNHSVCTNWHGHESCKGCNGSEQVDESVHLRGIARVSVVQRGVLEKARGLTV